MAGLDPASPLDYDNIHRTDTRAAAAKPGQHDRSGGKAVKPVCPSIITQGRTEKQE